MTTALAMIRINRTIATPTAATAMGPMGRQPTFWAAWAALVVAVDEGDTTTARTTSRTTAEGTTISIPRAIQLAVEAVAAAWALAAAVAVAPRQTRSAARGSVRTTIAAMLTGETGWVLAAAAVPAEVVPPPTI